MIIYLIFLIVGGLMLTAAVLNLKKELALLKGGERAVGTVVEMVERIEEDGPVYFPVFEIPNFCCVILSFIDKPILRFHPNEKYFKSRMQVR